MGVIFLTSNSDNTLVLERQMCVRAGYSRRSSAPLRFTMFL
jgi:hypothetical protein